MNTTQVRAMIKKAVSNLNLVLRVATPAPVVVVPVIEEPAVVEATVAQPVVVKDVDKVFELKTTNIGIGSYVSYDKDSNGAGYVVYGLTKTGRAKLSRLFVTIATQMPGVEVKTGAVEIKSLTLNRNFPVVGDIIVAKTSVAVNAKGELVTPTDEQLKAAYLICNS
jgi:hypothetical protein